MLKLIKSTTLLDIATITKFMIKQLDGGVINCVLLQLNFQMCHLHECGLLATLMELSRKFVNCRTAIPIPCCLVRNLTQSYKNCRCCVYLSVLQACGLDFVMRSIILYHLFISYQFSDVFCNCYYFRPVKHVFFSYQSFILPSIK